MTAPEFHSSSNPGDAPPQPGAPDVVWSFRGYKLRASEFTTAMVHLFRAEVQRANVWRQRLDTTTNWAVVTTGAAISVAFAGSGSNVVIFLNLFLVTIFLLIEARRYRYYELWSYRVRLMETDFFASMLVPPFHPSADWAEALSESLLHPVFPISTLEAIGRRLRRNFLFIYSVVGATWIAMLWLIPSPATTLELFVRRAAVGVIPGGFVLGAGILFAAGLITISVFTAGMHAAAGEVLPRYAAGDTVGAKAKKRAWFRPVHRRPQLLTMIITDQPQIIADQVLKNMNRGVTGMDGTGMFTGAKHTVLICALTITEIPQLKAIVAEADPNAFVIVSPAQEVFGRGFLPLQDED